MEMHTSPLLCSPHSTGHAHKGLPRKQAAPRSTHRSAVVDVWVPNGSDEDHLGLYDKPEREDMLMYKAKQLQAPTHRVVGVVCGKGDPSAEHAEFVWSVRRAEKHGLPLQEVTFINRACHESLGWRLRKVCSHAW